MAHGPLVIFQGLQSEVEHFQSATALMRGELQRQKDKLKKLQVNLHGIQCRKRALMPYKGNVDPDQLDHFIDPY